MKGAKRLKLRANRMSKRPYEYESTAERQRDGTWVMRVSRTNTFYNADGTRVITVQPDSSDDEVYPENGSGMPGLAEFAAGLSLTDRTPFNKLPQETPAMDEATRDGAAPVGRLIKSGEVDRIAVVKVGKEMVVCTTIPTGQTIIVDRGTPYAPSENLHFRLAPSDMRIIFRVGDELLVQSVSVLNRYCAVADILEGMSMGQADVGYGLVAGFTSTTNRPIIRVFQEGSNVRKVIGPVGSVPKEDLFSTVAFRYLRPLGTENSVIGVTPLSPFFEEEELVIPKSNTQPTDARLRAISLRDRRAVELPRYILKKIATPFGNLMKKDSFTVAEFYRVFQGYRLVCRTSPGVPMGSGDDESRPGRRVTKIVRYFPSVPIWEGFPMVECGEGKEEED
jgi:hypothetical protein